MIKEIKKHWGVILMLIIGVPFIFILALKLIYAFLPGKEIGEPGDWISFAGGYLGVIGAVWWQMKKEEKVVLWQMQEKKEDIYRQMQIQEQIEKFKKRIKWSDNFFNNI